MGNRWGNLGAGDKNYSRALLQELVSQADKQSPEKLKLVLSLHWSLFTTEACALLFDHSNCRDLKRDVPEGYTALGLLDRNDVESVLVKKGCTLILYDDNDEANVFRRGQSFGVTAYGQQNAVSKTLSGKNVSLSAAILLGTPCSATEKPSMHPDSWEDRLSHLNESTNLIMQFKVQPLLRNNNMIVSVAGQSANKLFIDLLFGILCSNSTATLWCQTMKSP